MLNHKIVPLLFSYQMFTLNLVVFMIWFFNKENKSIRKKPVRELSKFLLSGPRTAPPGPWSSHCPTARPSSGGWWTASTRGGSPPASWRSPCPLLRWTSSPASGRWRKHSKSQPLIILRTWGTILLLGHIQTLTFHQVLITMMRRLSKCSTVK